MHHPHTLLCAGVGLLVVLAAACSGGDSVTAPTTTVPAATSTPGLNDLTPFPPGLLPAGCAAETARDPGVFEAAVGSKPTLGELCAVVGPPDWVTGSGLLIVVYDLDDGGQIFVAYGGGGPLVYARWLASDGEERWLVNG